MRFLDRHQLPKRIGSFAVAGTIGEGGMCTVYLGRQDSLDRPVAIKLLKENLGNNPEARARFERESLIVARLNHPNIVHVVDRGITAEGAPYFVMEYLEGTDLAHALAERSLDRTRKLEIAIQVCRALAYAHRNGVIHRDIKPANILLDRDGNAVVTDFGIAKLVDASETRADLVLGTMTYMSPEQQTGGALVGPASDLYSLGVVLYEMLAGTKPLGRFRPPSECDPTLPVELDVICLRCLAVDPAERFSSADELRDRLLELLQGAHLGSAERERAGSGLERIRRKFALLDIIREAPSGALYLYQDRVDRRLLVIRKRMGSVAGLSEARLLGALRHRHVAGVLGASGDGRCFIVVMEYLAGGSLRDRLLLPLPLDEALRIGLEAAEGLAFAHRNRIVHGSLRPGNILFTDSEAVKVADFGFDEQAAGDPYNPFQEPRSTGADVLALGMILYQATTGLVPGWKDGVLKLYPLFLRLPPETREALAAMLHRNPEARVSSFDQVVARLHRARRALAGEGEDETAPASFTALDPGRTARGGDAADESDRPDPDDALDAGERREEGGETRGPGLLDRLTGRQRRKTAG